MIFFRKGFKHVLHDMNGSVDSMLEYTETASAVNRWAFGGRSMVIRLFLIDLS